ncbi:MAG: PAS domain S-box protein [Gammaproteobacteria bacterium]|nr:MAG: PAS domain S-box protein [Gammaproteobacteria bacterium]
MTNKLPSISAPRGQLIAEANLRASIFDALAEGVVVLDAQGEILDCNSAAEEILGIPRQQVLGRTPRDPRWRAIREDGTELPPDEMPSVITLRTHLPINRFVHGIVHVDGAVRWISVSSQPVIDESGGFQGVVASMADVTAQHEQAKRLVAQQAELDRFFDASLDMLCIATTDGRFVKLNPEWEACLGYPLAELEGRRFLDLIHPEDLAATRQALEALSQQTFIANFENRYRRRDGSYRWIEWRSTPIDGMIYASARDVTSRKDAEVALRIQTRELALQKQVLESVLDSPSTGFWDWHIARDYTYYNPSWLRMLGYSPGELPASPETWQQLIHPDDLHKAQQNYQAHVVSKGKEPFYNKVRYRHKDGSVVWVLCIGRVIEWSETGEPLRMTGCHIDITEAQTLEERLSVALSVSNTGLWEWCFDTGERYHSDECAVMLGYSPDEISFTTEVWRTLCHPEDLERARFLGRKHLNGETARLDCDYRLRAKSGGWVWVRDVAEVVDWAEDGAARRMLGVRMDVTVLREALMRAEEASLAKGEFLANTSHEIRTPLTAIIGYADLLTESMGLPCDTRRHALAIERNAQHLLTVINDVLDMSKIEAGQMLVECLPFDPVALLQEVVSLMEVRAAEKGLFLRVCYESALPVVICSDPTRLRQILLNVLGNAVKFTETGGVTVHVSCNPSARGMCFRVVDTGIGMTQSEREKVTRFAAFTQADSSMSRRFGGTGLGLRISNALAGLLGGQIEVESEAGKGSSFTVTIDTGDIDGVEISPLQMHTRATAAEIPLEGSHETSSPPVPAVETAQGLRGVRVLLAEDGPDNQRLIGFHLERAGAEVIVAENGLRAVELIESGASGSQPHLILMDMQMPELDGYDATRRLRAQGYRRPVIALTAHAMAGDREKCLKAGCDDYLSKPIDRRRLVEICALWGKPVMGQTTDVRGFPAPPQ